MLFILAYTNPAFAQQQPTIDSLKHLLTAAKQDKNKINLYNSLAKQYRFNDSSKVAYYASLAINLAQKNNYPKGIADAYYCLGWITYMKNHYKESERLFHKTLSISQKAKYPVGIANAYNGLGVVNKNQGNYTKAMQYYQQSLKVKIKVGDQNLIAHSYNNMGNVYTLQGNYKKALKHHYKALKLRMKYSEKRFEAMSYNNIGVAYQNMGYYSRALKYHQQSLTVAENFGDTTIVALNYGKIGNVYKSLGNYTQALQYYLRAVKIDKRLGNKYGLGSNYVAMGECYHQLNEFFHAKQVYQNALSISKKTNEQSTQSAAYQGLANVYLSQKQYKVSEKYFRKALHLRKKTKENALLSETLLGLGTVAYEQKKYDKVLVFTKEGMAKAQKSARLAAIRDVAALSAKTYEALKDFKKAYTHYQLYKQMEDSLVNKEIIRKISQAEDQYKYRKYQDSLTTARQQAEKRFETQIQQQKLTNRLRLYIAIASLLAMTLLLIGVAVWNKQKRKHILQNLVLKETQKELLEEQILRKEIEEVALREQLHIDEKIKEIFQVNLESKDHELTKQALYLVQKQQLIETWSQELTELIKQAKGTVKDNIQTLNKQMKKEVKATEAWNNFTQTFELAHPSFYKKLKTSFPELTTYELKLSALIRLNLDTYDIAEFMNISPESARKAKLRLRKKMNLPSTEALREYFRNM
ncbi:tetratricopeptide repeat domain protein [Microscilla marina ATCC 23134]|uniref:Tetratricopeptide repeat domain protein n=2 Tax=Microscilla marina TaxID=1027 RepID=A1ZQL6_MICM2|nr:tetratricopeptide repeat domain protein [Microscilla marina ATCC 23134]